MPVFLIHNSAYCTIKKCQLCLAECVSCTENVPQNDIHSQKTTTNSHNNEKTCGSSVKNNKVYLLTVRNTVIWIFMDARPTDFDKRIDHFVCDGSNNKRMNESMFTSCEAYDNFTDNQPISFYQ